MNPKPNARLIAAFDDLISEKDVVQKLGYSKSTLKIMRQTGQIKKWYSINGRKIQYSKTELAQLLNLHVDLK